MTIRPRSARRWFRAAACCLSLLMSSARARAEDDAPRLIGGAACAACHREEAARWRGSHHAQAMQVAGTDTVRGDFRDASFNYAGVTSAFSRRGDGFIVRTDGPDGNLRDYDIAYTFGVYPLQQYLVGFPGGRYQTLGIAWDARPAPQSGQRWFHLYPDEAVKHGDVLHWTRPSQNWNAMCADCHSTGLRRGYVAAENRYETRWSDLHVSCEACHGPGSLHVEWARRQDRAADASRGLVVRLSERASWDFEAGAPIAHRSPPLQSNALVESCAPCHARRSPLRDAPVPGAAFLDAYRPALLDEGLYHADGQIDAEVYEYGSFLQSKMQRAGVTCSDCHEPHALALRADGNALCSRCHAPAVFDSTAHHHHQPGSPASRCVACHMPSKTYMVIDERRDHSLRVPRPDLSARLETPNACNACHTDKTAAWAAEAIRGWPGTKRWREPHYGEAIAAGRRGAVDAAARLSSLADDASQPAIARATAASLLGGYVNAPDGAPLAALRRALASGEPLIRLGALAAVRSLAGPARRDAVLPLATDPLLAVRIEAARALAGVPDQLLVASQREIVGAGLAEYRAAELVQADRPEPHVNLAVLAVDLGRVDEAERELRTAMALGPEFVPAYVNLADLYRATSRDRDGEPLLRAALAIAPESAEAHHALGLLLIRQARVPEALAELDRAASLDPAEARYAYVLGVALHSTGDAERALAVLRSAHERRPADRDILVALATISRDRGDRDAARAYAEGLVALDPGDPAAQSLLRELSAPR